MQSASRDLRSSASRTGFTRRPRLAAHVLGFTDIDGHGGAGVERAFDPYLSDPRTRGKPLVLSIRAESSRRSRPSSAMQ